MGRLLRKTAWRVPKRLNRVTLGPRESTLSCTRSRPENGTSTDTGTRAPTAALVTPANGGNTHTSVAGWVDEQPWRAHGVDDRSAVKRVTL